MTSGAPSPQSAGRKTLAATNIAAWKITFAGSASTLSLALPPIGVLVGATNPSSLSLELFDSTANASPVVLSYYAAGNDFVATAPIQMPLGDTYYLEAVSGSALGASPTPSPSPSQTASPAPSPTASASISGYGGTVSIFAGQVNVAGSTDGIGTSATFGTSQLTVPGLAFDGSGNLYVSDSINGKIRKITPSGVVSTFAGSGQCNSLQPPTDGAAASATFCEPTGLAVDSSGNVFVANGFYIREITSSGTVTTLAGTGSCPLPGPINGPDTTSTFCDAIGVALDAKGDLYVADAGDGGNGYNQIRMITPSGVVSTVAGTATAGSQDGPASSASFKGLLGIAIDASGNVYVSDAGNCKIRKLTPAGIVSTVAGTGCTGMQGVDGPIATATFGKPEGLTVGSTGIIYVADAASNRIREITPAGMVLTYAGTGANSGAVVGTASTASFYYPSGVALDSIGNVYVSDLTQNVILKITP